MSHKISLQTTIGNIHDRYEYTLPAVSGKERNKANIVQKNHPEKLSKLNTFLQLSEYIEAKFSFEAKIMFTFTTIMTLFKHYLTSICLFSLAFAY